jgi:hypothetical protein
MIIEIGRAPVKEFLNFLSFFGSSAEFVGEFHARRASEGEQVWPARKDGHFWGEN